MKLIKPSVEWLPQEATLDGAKRLIELAGRTCYKSEDKVTEDSYKQFYDRMKNLGHLSVLEHGSIYLKINILKNPFKTLFYSLNKFSKVKVKGLNAYISTNLRVLEENNRYKDTKYICEPTVYHDKRFTFRIITSRVISQQFMRHRVFSVSQESQRYCNYSKDKFGDDILFIEPIWLEQHPDAVDILKSDYKKAENNYLTLSKMGVKAEDARDVLPNGVKTEFIYTGFTSDFLGNFHKLRSHRTAQKIMRLQEWEIYTTIKRNQ